MGVVKVHGPAMSTAVSRVLACLLEKEVEFHLLPIDLSKRHHKSPDFLKLQPFGQVPVFQDGDTTIFGPHLLLLFSFPKVGLHISMFAAESRAICRYICDQYPAKGNKGLFGGSPAERAAVDRWVEAEAQNFNAPASALVFQLVFGPRMRVKQDAAAIKENEGKLRRVLDVYERRLGESRFLAGEEFSLADLCHLPNAQCIVGASDRGHLFTDRKNVSRWWDEISGRPSWKKIVEMQSAPTAK